MRPVLMGLAMVASLAMSLVGVSVLNGTPPVAADCGGRYEDECVYDDEDHSQPPYDERQRDRDIEACLDHMVERHGVDNDRELPAGVGAACYDKYPAPSVTNTPTPELRRSLAYSAEIRRLDAWAEEHLAAEFAQATWWRFALWSTNKPTGAGVLQYLPDRTQNVQYVCDPNYDVARSGGCVPTDRDYDCGELRSWGIAGIPVVGEDWMLLDDDGDGWGCEVVDTVQEVEVALTPPAPTAEPTNQCDGILGALGCLLGR